MRNSGVIARRGFQLSRAFAVAAIAAAVVAVQAGSVSTTFFRIDVDNGVDNASWEVASNDPFVTYDAGTQTWDWSSAGQLIDLDGIVSVGSANLQVQGDPRISLGFALTAGELDTNVTITTTVLGFGALASPTGVGSVSMTLTDNGGDGASLAGLGGDAGSAYAAYYNIAPPGTLFAEFVDAMTAPAGGTDIDGGNTGGMVPMPGPLSSMQVVMSFSLSAGDQVSATSNYVVIPEASSVALLLGGSLALLKRRR